MVSQARRSRSSSSTRSMHLTRLFRPDRVHLEQLKPQGGQINQQASSSTIDIEKLQVAFNNVFETMDGLRHVPSAGRRLMAQTVTAIEGQLNAQAIP